MRDGFPHKIELGLVSIILPVYLTNYSLFHYTGNCIGNVRAYTKTGKYELIVVDNGSPIQPPSLQSYYADRVIKNTDNLGYTKACNQGIRMSRGEFIVLLSNDVQVFENWLEGMLEGIKSGNDLVMAHPMYSLTEPFARAIESRAVWDGRKKFDSIPGGKDFSCVMFERSLVDEIGTLDEQFFNYCSDTDFLKRMDEAGRKYAMIDRVATSHLSDATGFSISETPEIMNKDKALFKEKWESTRPSSRPPVALFRTRKHGDSIFLVSEGFYYHIENPETLKALGFKFGDEILIDDFPDMTQKGENIDMANYQKYAKI